MSFIPWSPPSNEPRESRARPSRIEEVRATDEVLLWRIRPNALAYLGATPILLFVMPLALYALTRFFDHLPADVRWWAYVPWWVALLFTVHGSLSVLLIMRRIEYAASNERLLLRQRDYDFFAACAVDVVPVQDIKGVTVGRSFADRIARTGTVLVTYAVRDKLETARLLGVRFADDVAARIRAASLPTRDAAYR